LLPAQSIMRALKLLVVSLTLASAASAATAAPTRAKLRIKYRDPAAQGYSTYGEQATLKLKLRGADQIGFMRQLVKDAQLPLHGNAKSAVIKQHPWLGSTTLVARGDNADIRRLEAQIMSSTEPERTSTGRKTSVATPNDKIVDRQPE
jgi:hypothetical protein